MMREKEGGRPEFPAARSVFRRFALEVWAVLCYTGENCDGDRRRMAGSPEGGLPMERTGGVLDKLCTLCAVLFCGVIVVQNLLFIGGRGQWLSAVSLLITGTAALVCAGRLPEGRYVPWALFGVRFLSALAVILLVGAQPVQDFSTMYTAACQLAAGSHEYLSLDTCYFYNWAYQTAFVVYESLVIRIFGEGYLALQVLNALYMGGTAALTYAIGRRLLPGRGALAAGVLYVLYPAPLFLAAVLTNQHLSVFLLYLGVWVLVSGKDGQVSLPRAALAGLLFALGNAIRPIGIVVLLAVLLWCLIGLARRFTACRERILPALARPALLAVCYVLAGALLAAAVVWSGANPWGLSNNQPMWKFVLGLNEESSGAWNAEDYNELYLLQGEEADAAMRETVRERLLVGPVRLARLMWNKCELMWADNEYMSWGFGHLDHSADLAGPLTVGQGVNLACYWDKGAYLLLFALALAALVRRLLNRRPRARTLLPVQIFCGYFAVHLLIEVQSRYRYFLMPTIALLAGWALARLLSREKEKDA